MAQWGIIYAHGLVVDLSAEVLGVPVISADATVGNVAVPGTGGSPTANLVPISLPGAVGVTASGMVQRVSVSSLLLVSSGASASVNGLSLAVLGVDVLDATEVSSGAVCPVFGGGMNSNVRITGLRLFGTAVTLGPPVTGSAARDRAGPARRHPARHTEPGWAGRCRSHGRPRTGHVHPDRHHRRGAGDDPGRHRDRGGIAL
jgi:hypothetical protein